MSATKFPHTFHLTAICNVVIYQPIYQLILVIAPAENKQDVAYICIYISFVIIGRPCEFPLSWQTRWFSGNSGEVRIYASVFTGKGLCVQSVPGYYLMENK